MAKAIHDDSPGSLTTNLSLLLPTPDRKSETGNLLAHGKQHLEESPYKLAGLGAEYPLQRISLRANIGYHVAAPPALTASAILST